MYAYILGTLEGVPADTVADPGGIRGIQTPYQTWRLLDTGIVTSTGSYITFKVADYFNETRVEFCHWTTFHGYLKNCFRVPNWRLAFTDWETRARLWEVIYHKKSPTAPFEPKLGPPPKKIPRSPPPVIYHKLLLISGPANKPRPPLLPSHPILG